MLFVFCISLVLYFFQFYSSWLLLHLNILPATLGPVFITTTTQAMTSTEPCESVCNIDPMVAISCSALYLSLQILWNSCTPVHASMLIFLYACMYVDWLYLTNTSIQKLIPYLIPDYAILAGNKWLGELYFLIPTPNLTGSRNESNAYVVEVDMCLCVYKDN